MVNLRVTGGSALSACDVAFELYCRLETTLHKQYTTERELQGNLNMQLKHGKLETSYKGSGVQPQLMYTNEMTCTFYTL